MYIWNIEECALLGDYEGLLAGQWLSAFIQGGAQNFFKWTNK